MGHSHAHSHGHNHSTGHLAGRHRWRLQLSFGLVACLFVVELIAGLASGSLALISDAGHMAADLVALGAALFAIRLAQRPDTTGRRSYGSYRAEVFASGLTVLIMVAVAVYVVIEAIGRIGREVPIASTSMLVVGAIGLVINVLCMLLLRNGAEEALSVKGAYFEVVADAVGSIGVMAAGLLVAWTSHALWDTVIALAIGAFVAFRAIVLGRQVVAVLAQHTPEGVILPEVIARLSDVPGVVGVHDLHAWTLTSGMNVATVHLLVEPTADTQQVLTNAQELLHNQYGIEHATLQVEIAPTRQCEDVDW